jgi:hypothetical protein
MKERKNYQQQLLVDQEIQEGTWRATDWWLFGGLLVVKVGAGLGEVVIVFRLLCEGGGQGIAPTPRQSTA